MNRVRLRARLVARAELRYTPAGIAILQCELRHDGVVAEAGVERTLGFELPAIAVGEAASRLDRQPLGSELELTGFIAPRTRRSRTLVVHITEFKPI